MIDSTALRRAFGDYARTILGDYSVGEVLYRLTDQCVEVLGIDGAGVSLGEGEALQFVAATDEDVVRVEETQVSVGEGPCYEAYTTGRAVFVVDLRHEDRWPSYRAGATGVGLAAVAGLPMAVADERVGAVNLYRKAPHEWTDEEAETGQLLADMATGYILNARKLDEHRTLAEQLQHALDSRVIVERANGMLAQRHDLPVAEAFERLRTYARAQRRRIHEVAAEIVAGELDL
ncbi:ANTAR domain-containing protein [Egibacter rhizosphaerae]|uniref:ANTAR domain-containing protein n=1 Tax=Egibacter rhizosphaerae TaxID=1670831 RepID=A0A411YEQ3_9ACTN|nr:GAF and ANTAR domain-containing protein [Egibacter rhizosphaerae]QBI19680.1 ANTAR domain-containing protein [Egibacter rhizosphaerae]